VTTGIDAYSTLPVQFYIVNKGGTAAIIKEILCEFYFSSTMTLPAKRPWEGKSGSECNKGLLPGVSVPHLFEKPEPLDENTAEALRSKNSQGLRP
jgi:hypothetical protein